MKKLILLLALFAGFFVWAEEAENLTVPSGETVDITSDAKYGTVTVNGTLNLKGGTLSATEVRISDGSGNKLGKVSVNGGTISCGTLYVGYNGGTAEFEIVKGNTQLITTLVLGDGNGAGNVYRISGGFHQGQSVVNRGTDSEVVFGGGYVKLSSSCFVPEAGNLTLKATSGKTMNVRPFSTAGYQYLFDPDGKYTGTVRTEGPGALNIYCLKSGGYVRLTSLPGNRMTWAHTGGVNLTSGTATTVAFSAYGDGDFFTQGGTPQDVYLSMDSGKAAQVFDVNGLSVAVRSISSNSKYLDCIVTNKKVAAEGAVRIVQDDGTASLKDAKLIWDPAVRLIKDGTCRLNLLRDGFAAPLTVKDGVLNVATNIAPGDIVQDGGLIEIAANCKMTLADGTSWANPSMSDDSQGVVETSGNVSFDGDAINLKGPLNVVSGALTCPGTAGSTWHRYFRFIIQYSTARAKNDVALSRLRFMDADGNVLSDGLTKVEAGTPAKDMPAGTCCYGETGYSEGTESDIVHLFDGLTTTQMHLSKCNFPSSTDLSQNTWRIINVHLPESAVARVAKYQLTTGTDVGDNQDLCQRRAVSIWKMESSSDGVNWIAVGSENEFSWDKLPITVGTDYKNGPFLIKEGVCGPESVSIGKLSVASGASADFTGKDVSVDELAVDMGAYAGGNATITGFAPSNDQTLTLVNAADALSYVLPITFPGLADAVYTTWNIAVNGEALEKAKVRVKDETVTIRLPQGLMLLFK